MVSFRSIRNALSPESKLMTFMSRVGDLVILNLLFLLTSLPIVTIGASCTALYSVCFHFGTDKEKGLFRGYFSAFRDNFKQATVLWLLILLFGGLACLNIYLFLLLPNWLSYLSILFFILLVVVVLVFSYTFPLLSQFDNKNKQTLLNALILSVGYFPRSLVLLVLNALPWVLLLTDLITFLQAGFFWIAIYFSAAAYLGTKLLKKVFAPYMPQESDNDAEEIEGGTE